MTPKASASLTHAEMLVDAACVVIESNNPHDLLAVLMLAIAEVVVRCNPDGDLDKVAEQSASMAGPALAEMIGKVRDVHRRDDELIGKMREVRLRDVKPEGNA